MGTVNKILLVTFLAGGLVFARSGNNNPRVEDKKVKSEHYWAKDQSENGDKNKLDRKRSHKRRRRVRKPVKGLR